MKPERESKSFEKSSRSSAGIVKLIVTRSSSREVTVGLDENSEVMGRPHWM